MTRRAISQIIGSMLMLAIVLGAGATIMFSGFANIQDFNNLLRLFGDDRNEGFLEDLVVEHVRFFPSGSNVTITIRNIGDAQITIDSIVVVKIDTQELVLSDTTISQTVLIGDFADIEENFTLTQGTGQFNDGNYTTSEYMISVTTTRANSFEMTATPFNT